MELTQRAIEDGLRAVGLQEGAAVEVHSSLSSLGHVTGGPGTVVDALMSVVGPNGALVMSNYPLSRPMPLTAEEKTLGIGWKLRRLPDDSDERTATGAVSDEFRRRADVVSGSGVHRVSAWGRDAELHSRGYRHLVDVDGLVLLLGVGIDRCSSMHLSEEVEVSEEAQREMQMVWPNVDAKLPDAVKQSYPADIIIGPKETNEYPRAWENARDEADRRGQIRKGKVGQADSMLFKVRVVLALLEEIRRSGPLRPLR